MTRGGSLTNPPPRRTSGAGRLTATRTAGRSHGSGGRFPPLEPPAKRLLRFTGSSAGQKTGDADVFIQVRPVDALAARNQAPVGALRRRPVSQTREPGQRRRNRPAIREVRHQRVVTNADAPGQRFRYFIPRSTHAMTPTKKQPVPRSAARSAESPPGRNLCFFPNGPGPARISPSPHPAPRAREVARLDPPSRRRTDMVPREERSATLSSLHGQEADWRGRAVYRRSLSSAPPAVPKPSRCILSSRWRKTEATAALNRPAIGLAGIIAQIRIRWSESPERVSA
jgi:hypothetical protein